MLPRRGNGVIIGDVRQNEDVPVEIVEEAEEIEDQLDHALHLVRLNVPEDLGRIVAVLALGNPLEIGQAPVRTRIKQQRMKQKQKER